MQGGICCPGPARLRLDIHVPICEMGAGLHGGSHGSCRLVGDGKMHFKDVHVEISQSADVTFHSKRDLAEGTKALISGKIMLMCPV